VLTAIYKDQEWNDVEGGEFLFYDGTPNQPMPLITTFDFNYVTQGVRATGIFLMSFAVAIAAGSAAWVFANRASKQIKLSQPEFLYLMCFGSTLVSSSVAFLSFDESQGLTEDELSQLCAVFPWFFVVGYLIIYCAIFSKLWRIFKLMSMTRQRITFQRALWPFAIFFTGNLIVLLCWQLIDPLKWERIVIHEEPLHTSGKCTSENATPFIASLGVMIAVITGMNLIISWKTRDLQDEIAEVKWIFYGIFSHVQTWAIGIPVFIVLNTESTSLAYLIRSVLTFLFSTIMVVIVIWPKMYMVHYRAKFEKRRAVTVGTGQVRICGVLDPNNSTVTRCQA
jgi:gamma-aminobutyric acid type B receptor